MARFLTTAGISTELEEIITKASERLVLISPFLKVTDRLKELIEDKARFKDIDIRVIYGKNELQPEENNWLDSLSSVRTSFRKNLHAKCYMNEKTALLTSMNLYEYSQQNNDEMGILVSYEEDEGLYRDINEYVRRIMRGSEEVRITVAKVEATEGRNEDPKAKKSRKTTRPPNAGFCIRCKTDLSANPTQPYCKRCYASWKRYENKTYEENHCHTCGKEHKTTLLKPSCSACYSKYKDVLEFAVG